MSFTQQSASQASGLFAQRRVSVLLALPFQQSFTYLGEEEPLAPGSFAPGSFVKVPFGKREALGVVWDDPPDETVDEAKLKPITEIPRVPPLPEAQRRFIDWVSEYTLALRGQVLKMALSSPSALDPEPERKAYLRSGLALSEEFRITPARHRVLEIAAEGFARPASDLAKAAGVGVSVVKGLADLGLLETVALRPRAKEQPRGDAPGPQLSAGQAQAAEALCQGVKQGKFKVNLLEGVTGSGKTEVYFEALAQALREDKQVLVLLPEIALSAQWLERFQARFGAPPAEWHSDLTSAQRRRTWRAVQEGEARVVVGARSALFLPFSNLGLIIVDEEHEAAFKQEDGVIYHARDMAVVRAHLEAVPIILASATPSLETLANVAAGKYERLHLPERHGLAVLPDVELLDLRKEAPEKIDKLGAGWLSPPLRRALEETFERGEQALLFLNRRGYAPLTLCRACGYRFQCPNCAAWLVEHRFRKRLMCHHCGYALPPPPACPSCQAEDSLVACGPGIERLSEEVAALFPEARQQIISSDSLPGPSAVGETIRRIQDQEVDLIIGTQIVAKGHNFPALTLVGVVDADLGLSGGDPRALERSFQLLHQVSGRAGRAERRGRALIQTYAPEHPVMQALAQGDHVGFIEREMQARRQGGLPPFTRFAAVIISDKDPKRLEDLGRYLLSLIPRAGSQGEAFDEIQVLGPAPAPLAILRGRYRQRFLVKAPRTAPLQAFLRSWVQGVKLKGSSRLAVDVDPYSFL